MINTLTVTFMQRIFDMSTLMLRFYYPLTFSAISIILFHVSLLISTGFFYWKVGQKDHQRFQSSYATILKAHMTSLKKRERKDRKKSAETDKREGSSKKAKKV